jgi:hypothetical protein
MAQISDNIFTEGIRGMIAGQIVFRSWNGKTFVYKSPRKPTKQSAIQRENRSKFRRATAFAKKMMKDIVKKAEYQEVARKLQLPNAYTAAVTEYMRRPEIADVEILESVEIMEVKVVTQKKGFKLQEVEIVTLDEKGREIEKGQGRSHTQNIWHYCAENGEKVFEIMIKATDQAGNKVEKKYRKESFAKK